ncbi:hypothetical protein CTAYLR_004613 [Chrysophaeum taylorii]|uniref:EF-hand domain-containing protein n=1 Tax=Chrysophaeum taylorii TaxID=2483200 RepID=A0AAD7XIQ4_9STRA|nr:hypothetical protein CTAYLR_004613 [Chrysophaeum taylorii]
MRRKSASETLNKAKGKREVRRKSSTALQKGPLGDAYRKHGHERLKYHARQERVVGVTKELGLPETQDEGKHLQRLDALAPVAVLRAPEEQPEEEPKRSGIGLYTEHLATIHDQCRPQDAAPKPEYREEQRRADYGDDRRLACLCAPLWFAPYPFWRRCRRAPPVQLAEGCAPAAVRLLELTEAHLRHLWSCFCRVDLDASGAVSVDEFLQYLDTEASSFVKVFMDNIVFDWADLNTDGLLNYGEFVVSVATICCLSRRELLHFLFQVFDDDNSGFIERTEFQHLAKAVLDLGSLFPGNYGTFFNAVDANDDDAIDFDEFVRINDRFPMLFFPAAKLQDAVRRHTFRVDFWETKAADFSRRNNGQRFHAAINEAANKIVWRPITPPDPPPPPLPNPPTAAASSARRLSVLPTSKHRIATTSSSRSIAPVTAQQPAPES